MFTSVNTNSTDVRLLKQHSNAMLNLQRSTAVFQLRQSPADGTATNVHLHRRVSAYVQRTFWLGLLGCQRWVAKGLVLWSFWLGRLRWRRWWPRRWAIFLLVVRHLQHKCLFKHKL